MLNMEKQGLSIIPAGNAKWYSHFGRLFGSFVYKAKDRLGDSLVTQIVKNLPAMQETWV